jgi:hypothetical protein
MVNGEYVTMRLVGDGTNVAYAGLDLDAFVLPTNNDQFTIQEYSDAIVGTLPVAYTLFSFDATSDSIIEATSLIGTTFTYTSSVTPTTATITAATAVGVLTSQVGVELVDGVSELEVISTTETGNEIGCTQLEVWSQTVDYVEKLIGRGDIDNSEMSYLGVDVMLNCCESGVESFKLAPIYDFTLSASDCAQDELGTIVVIGPDSYQLWETTVTLGGIDTSVITELRYSGANRNFPNTMQVNGGTPVNEFRVQYLMPDTLPVPVVPETYLIQVTNSAGFVYNIQYTLTPASMFTPGTCDNISFEFDSISYPENPCYVSVVEDVDRTYLLIDSQLYNGCLGDEEVLESMADGIYQVTLSDSGISNEFVTGCEFVNCETRCLVIEALAKECDPIISIVYDALVDSRVCDNVTCQNLCDLYEMLQALLSACDCAKYSNNKVQKKPCKTCKGGW